MVNRAGAQWVGRKTIDTDHNSCHALQTLSLPWAQLREHVVEPEVPSQLLSTQRPDTLPKVEVVAKMRRTRRPVLSSILLDSRQPAASACPCGFEKSLAFHFGSRS